MAIHIECAVDTEYTPREIEDIAFDDITQWVSQQEDKYHGNVINNLDIDVMHLGYIHHENELLIELNGSMSREIQLIDIVLATYSSRL